MVRYIVTDSSSKQNMAESAQSIVKSLDYRSIYEKSPILLRTINTKGVIIACNESYAKYFGYAKKEVIGKSIFSHVAKKSHESMRSSFQEWKKTGNVQNKEIWFRRKNGTLFMGLISANNIYKENGKLIGSNTVIRDMTEIYHVQKKIEKSEEHVKEQFEQLKKSHKLLSTTEKKYRNLYEKSPSLLRSVTIDGIITDCNESYAKSFGYSKRDIVGMSLFDHTAEKSLIDMKKELNNWKKSEIVTRTEIWCKRKNGTVFPTLLDGTSLYDENEKLIGRTAVLTDLTEIYAAKKKLEESESHIREKLNQLKKLDAIKNEFLAMITHELKTPLVPIIGYADILLSEIIGNLNEAQKNRLGIIKNSTVALLKLISDLLDAQKIELGQLNINKKIHDLSKIIGNTVNKMMPDAEHTGITITTDLQPNILCLCDNIRIEQVMTNLISNALDFCPKDIGKIHIKLHHVDGHAKITVKDNGIGMIKTDIDKIFVKFYQVDTKTTREHGGTGLGLSVCKGIVESHGGKIWAESKGRNKGAEIHILLPF